MSSKFPVRASITKKYFHISTHDVIESDYIGCLAVRGVNVFCSTPHDLNN